MSASAQPKSAEPSMEEILASIRRIISDDQPAVVEETPVAPKPVAIVPPVSTMQAPVEAKTMVPMAAALPEDEEDVLDLTAPVQAAPLNVQMTAEPVMPMVMPEPGPKMAMSGEHLISNATDAVVANAFGSLAHTVLTQNARTLDDVVKDMLRPMLKSWLDDNLPMIVERLVRAEIERVARGAR